MPTLSDEERLALQQLRLLEWAERRSSSSGLALSRDDEVIEPAEPVHRWQLNQGITLAPWQQEARDRWFQAGMRGTIKVVTGAGKTVLAMAVAERLQERDPALHMAIVVPTIVLMNQWFENFRSRSNLPESAIGRLGGGYAETFNQSRRILIAVLASGRKELPRLVREARVSDHLLLVADECHRAGAPEMSAVLDAPYRYSLGLSATPERDDREEEGPPAGYEESLLGRKIGPIVYEMTYAEAMDLGVLPPFEIHHFGLPLSPDEARRYESLSRSISDARRELMAASPSASRTGSGDNLVAWARRISRGRDSGLADTAARFMNDTTRRKQLVYRAASRVEATRRLVANALESRPDARVILFHESIEEVTSLFDVLRRAGIPAVMEHSELPQELRDASTELFRTGRAKVIVSARSLIEGFNVPAADLGIIVASSSSPRQRIQSIGRVLRTYRDNEGSEKTSRVCVLYVRDSVDERIYEREDWERLVGLGRNRYFKWDPPGDPIEMANPPRTAVLREEDIDLNALRVGDPYPGWYEGAEYSTDSQGNVRTSDGQVARNPQGVPPAIYQLKQQPGRFRVTPQKSAILVRVPADAEEWMTLYGGRLSEPFEFGNKHGPPAAFDAFRLASGDLYPGPIQPAQEFRFRQRGGGVIAKRVPGGEAFAKGPNAERLVTALQQLRRGEEPISRIYLNQLGHAFWRDQGQPRLIAILDGPIEFPAEVRE